MAHRKRRKPSKSEVRAAADRAERPPEDEPTTELVPIDPVIGADAPKLGRPTKYDSACLKKVRQWAMNGATDFEIAQNLGVSTQTFYNWTHAHPEFLEAVRLGKLAMDRRVERSLAHRAVGYTYEATKVMHHQGEVIYAPYVEHVPPDVGAATNWLANRQPKRWKIKSTREISGPDGGPILTEDVGDLELGRRLAFVLSRLARKIRENA